MTSTPSKPPLTAAKVRYRLFRGVTRVGTMPLRRAPEGTFKNRVRSRVLRWQHSLPTELAVNRGDVVVQVGTPNPRTVLRLARAVGERGRVVVVEAMPENQDRIRAAISAHALEHVQVIPAAASDHNGVGQLMISPLWGDHKLAVEGVRIDNDARAENAKMSPVPVRLVRLDDALDELGLTQFDYLSVTVNGAEALVLQGAAGLLEASPTLSRVYVKGHALTSEGRPIHSLTREIVEQFGFRTVVTRGEPASTQSRRAGDLFAWKA